MADLAQLEAALVKADAAGDSDGARILAGEVRKMRGAAQVPSGLNSASDRLSRYTQQNAQPWQDAASEIDAAPYNVGAAVNDKAAKYVSPEIAAGLGTAANFATSLVPMAVGGAAGGMAQPAFQAMGKNVMQRALKPTVADFRKGKADRAVETLLDEGVNVSRGGVEKLRGMGEKLNARVADEIAGSTATVDKNAVAARLLDTEKKFTAQVNPQSDLNAIDDVWTNFLKHPQLSGNQTMPIQLAQELKQGTQARLKAKYGEMGDASTEAQKALAFGLRKEIERGAPAVGPLNRKASDLWNALNVTERRALIGGNNNPVSLPTVIGAAHNPAFGASMIVNSSDLAKSLAARLLYSGQLPANAGRGAGLAYALQQDQEARQ